MKKLTSLLVCMFILCVCSLRADNDKPIPTSQLPTAAQQLIQQHFATRKVALATVETKFLAKSYEVIFNDGDHIEFDHKGNWKEIECPSSQVPAALVPAPIRRYIRENYSDATVKKLEKGSKEYEVKLSNRMELSFDLQFNLTHIER